MIETDKTVVFVGTPGEGLPDPRIAAAAELGAAALVLAMAAAFAWYRARRRAGAKPRPLLRVLLAAGAFTLGFVVRDGAWLIVSHSWRTWVWARGDLVARAALFWVAAALLFAFADWVLASLDARRDRVWLVAAPPLFAILVLAPLRLTWMPEDGWLATMIAFAINGATGGLVWWSLLPAARAEAAAP